MRIWLLNDSKFKNGKSIQKSYNDVMALRSNFLNRIYILLIFRFALREVSVFGVILVRIFPAFSRIRNEHGEIRTISPYSVRMRENTEKMWTRITPNADSFYAVLVYHFLRKSLLKSKEFQGHKCYRFLSYLRKTDV